LRVDEPRNEENKNKNKKRKELKKKNEPTESLKVDRLWAGPLIGR
jgi:hypothetical protein